MIDHPIFRRFEPHRKSADDWLGARFAVDFTHGAPVADEELFEWISLLEAVYRARERFTMLELGAGYGRWGIRGAFAARAIGLTDIEVRLVEAEPQHAAWAVESVRLNELEESISVIEAAVSNNSRPMPFAIEMGNLDAASWYGQSVVAGDHEAKTLTEERYFGYPVYRNQWFGQIYVPSITLEKAAQGLNCIDLIDADLQGAEAELLPWMDFLTSKVRAIHIGTHSTQIEEELRQAFQAAGWLCQWDFSLQEERDTPFGRIKFGDGVQSWLNPRL